MAVPDSESHRAGAAVLPVAIGYRYCGKPTTRAAYIGDQTLVGSMVAILSLPGLEVTIEGLEPMSATSMADARHGLAAQSREQSAQAVCRHWSGSS